MFAFLLAVIYLAFISLGLPDGLLGAAWPVMHTAVEAPLSAAGILSVIITVGTILSSLASDRLTRRFGTGVVTAVSVCTTAVALFGFSVSSALWQLCLWALPYGLGAGAVDAALNNYVALHYKARHMNWLHCFWGVGACVGPYIMSTFLANDNNWPAGYRTVSFIQIAISICLFFCVGLFKNNHRTSDPQTSDTAPLGLWDVCRIRGVKSMLSAFFCYCASEYTLMVWSCTYLTEHHRISADVAASIASLFYLGMMLGRMISGFLSDRWSDKKLIRIGTAVLALGLCVLALPLPHNIAAVAGLLIIGLGCSPIYPSIIHSTPYNFGENRSQAIIGVEMAAAYAGSCLVPPLFGLIANHISAAWFIPFLFVFFVVMFVMTEQLNRITKERRS